MVVLALTLSALLSAACPPLLEGRPNRAAVRALPDAALRFAQVIDGAVCHQAAGDLVKAMLTYNDAAAWADALDDVPRRQLARDRAAALKARIGWLAVRTPRGAPRDTSLRIAGEPVAVQGDLPVSHPVNPGTIEVQWSGSGFRPIEMRTIVQAGQTVTLELPDAVAVGADAPPAAVLAPPPLVLVTLPSSLAGGPPSRIGPWVLLAGGGVLTAVSIGLFAAAQHQLSRFQIARTAGAASVEPAYTPAEQAWVQSPGFAVQYYGSLSGLVVGAGLVVAGVGWLLLGPRDPVLARVAFTGQSLVITGIF